MPWHSLLYMAGVAGGGGGTSAGGLTAVRWV